MTSPLSNCSEKNIDTIILLEKWMETETISMFYKNRITKNIFSHTKKSFEGFQSRN